MTAPTIDLSLSGVDPKQATIEDLEASVNGALATLYNHATAAGGKLSIFTTHREALDNTNSGDLYLYATDDSRVAQIFLNDNGAVQFQSMAIPSTDSVSEAVATETAARTAAVAAVQSSIDDGLNGYFVAFYENPVLDVEAGVIS